MSRNYWRITLASVLLINILAVLVAVCMVIASPETVVTVSPKVSVTAPGELFEINVTVSDVSDLYGWQFNVTFNPAVLNCTGVEEGPFLKQAGSTFLPAPTIDNTGGFVFLGDSLFPYPPTGASGNGTLATITFNVTAEGESNLHFFESVLMGYNPVQKMPKDIPHTAVDGFFKYPLWRDVAVTEVMAYPLLVTAGEIVSINVTVKNEGNITETFDVTVSYDSTIRTKIATDLDPDVSETLSFSWNTTDVDEGNYTITAEATHLSGETEIADNTHSEIVVTVTPPVTEPSPSLVIPIELLVGVIVAVVTACAAIFLYMKRRRSKT